MFEAKGAQKTGKPIYRQKKAVAALFLTIAMAVVHFAGWATTNHYWAYILGLMVVGMLDTMYEKAKNRTKGRLVAGNMHFSISSDHIASPGDLKIFSLGGIVYKMFPPMSGDEGTLVTRKELVEKMGENGYVIHGDMHRVEFSELPISAQKEIESTGDYGEPYYMTRVPKYSYLDMEEVRDRIESLMDLEDTNERLNARISTLREMSSMELEDFEDWFDAMERIGGKGKMEKAIEKLTGGGESEE